MHKRKKMIKKYNGKKIEEAKERKGRKRAKKRKKIFKKCTKKPI